MPPVIISFTDNNDISIMAETFVQYFSYATVYNTMEPEGRLVYDVEHCKRYCASVSRLVEY